MLASFFYYLICILSVCAFGGALWTLIMNRWVPLRIVCAIGVVCALAMIFTLFTSPNPFVR